MAIPRGVTPTFELTLEGVDLTQAENVYVTFSFSGGQLDKSGDDLVISAETEGDSPESLISLTLSQEETLKFHHGKIEIQVNWTYPDGSRACSEIAKADFSRQLLGRVIE